MFSKITNNISLITIHSSLELKQQNIVAYMPLHEASSRKKNTLYSRPMFISSDKPR